VGRAALGLAAIALTISSVTFDRSDAEVCPDPTVFYVDGCIFADSLSVLLNDDQSRADLQAAIDPFGGEIDIAVDQAGIYSVRFPITNVRDLDGIMQALVAAGFRAGFSIPASLNATL
jgi:hypothetical protein